LGIGLRIFFRAIESDAYASLTETRPLVGTAAANNSVKDAQPEAPRRRKEAKLSTYQKR
jgi:hypothetical protein